MRRSLDLHSEIVGLWEVAYGILNRHLVLLAD